MLFVQCSECTARWAVRPTIALLRRLQFDPDNQVASDYGLLEEVSKSISSDVAFAILPAQVLQIDASIVGSDWRLMASNEPLVLIEPKTLLMRRTVVRQLLMIVGASAELNAKENHADCLSAIRCLRERRRDVYSQFLQWTCEVGDA